MHHHQHQHQHGNYNNNNHAEANNTNSNSYSSWQSSYSLNALPLSPTVRAKLQFCGFNAVQDVLRHHSLPVQLVKSVPSLTLDEAQDVLKACRAGLDGFALRGAKSASELLKKEQERIPLMTFCAQVDGILGGGVQTGEITEFCGAPGVGKTQIGMQLAVSVQLPKEFFCGNEGECVYVDTEGSFTCDRCEDMAIGARRKLEERVQEMRCSEEERREYEECLESNMFSVDSILKRIHVSRGDGVVGVFGSHAGVCQGASKGETRGRGFDRVSFSTRFRRHGVESVDFSENDEQFDEFSEETRISRGDYKSSDDETRGQVGAGVRGVIRARGDDESRVIMGRGRN